MSAAIVNILLVEDNPGDVRLLRESLGQVTEARCQLVHHPTLGAALEHLAATSPDVILLDLGLPDAQGLEAVRRMHAAAPAVPIVVLTGLDDESAGVQALHEGAQDFLVKADVSGPLVWRALRYAMERQRIQLVLVAQAMLDDLTGLTNRRGFTALAGHHRKLARRTGRPFLIGFVDVDRLKEINDTFGHQEGNRALVDTANLLKDCFRQSDILSRVGGDEFAVLIVDATKDDSSTIAQRVLAKLEAFNREPGRRYALSFSMGLVLCDAAGTATLDGLLDQADALMYEEKQKKKAARAT